MDCQCTLSLIEDKEVSLAEFRSRVMDFEKMMLSNERSLGKDPFPLKHMFADGLYVREATAPAGTLLVSEILKKNHVTFILRGNGIVWSEMGRKEYYAPCSFITKSGTKRVVFCETETTWSTVHGTEARTVEDAENDVTVKRFEDLPEPREIPQIVYER